MDRRDQAHHLFDQWQSDVRHFVCRINGNTQKEILAKYSLPENSHVFKDVKAILDTTFSNQTQKPVRLVGYTLDDKNYWIVTPTVSI